MLACDKEEGKNTTSSPASLDHRATNMQQIMLEKNIPSAPLASVKKEAVMFLRKCGKASVEHDFEISDHFIFRVYS